MCVKLGTQMFWWGTDNTGSDRSKRAGPCNTTYNLESDLSRLPGIMSYVPKLVSAIINVHEIIENSKKVNLTMPKNQKNQFSTSPVRDSHGPLLDSTGKQDWRSTSNANRLLEGGKCVR